MDGKFVSQKGLLPTKLHDLVGHLPKDKHFEAHLMVENPLRYLDATKKLGFERVLFHAEAVQKNKTRSLIEAIQEKNMKAGMVLNPKTPISAVTDFLPLLDTVMFMGHKPGVEHIAVDSLVYKKIQSFHKEHPKVRIEVDGGVDFTTLPLFMKAGATRFSVGSAISATQNPKQSLRELRALESTTKNKLVK